MNTAMSIIFCAALFCGSVGAAETEVGEDQFMIALHERFWNQVYDAFVVMRAIERHGADGELALELAETARTNITLGLYALSSINDHANAGSFTYDAWVINRFRDNRGQVQNVMETIRDNFEFYTGHQRLRGDSHSIVAMLIEKGNAVNLDL